MSQGSHVAPPHPPHQHALSRLCSILSAAYRFYSCCCYTKTSDSAGGPDHLSFFASSDQLSYLNNCFDLLSFFISPLDSIRPRRFFAPLIPSCFGYSKVCLLSPIAVSLCHRSCLRFRINFSLLNTFRKVSLMPPVLFLVTLQPLYESLHSAPYAPMYVILSACRVNEGYNHI